MFTYVAFISLFSEISLNNLDHMFILLSKNKIKLVRNFAYVSKQYFKSYNLLLYCT